MTEKPMQILTFESWFHLAKPIHSSLDLTLFDSEDQILIDTRDREPGRIWGFFQLGKEAFLVRMVRAKVDPNWRLRGYFIEGLSSEAPKRAQVFWQFELNCPYCKGFGFARDYPEEKLTKCFYCEGSRRVLIRDPTIEQLERYKERMGYHPYSRRL